MRIAFVIDLFPPTWVGGSEIATYNAAEQLAKRGYDVHVITKLLDEDLQREHFEHGFTIHRISLIKSVLPRDFQFWMSIVLLLRKIDPDLIQAQGVSLGIPGIFIKLLLKKPYILYSRSSPDVVFQFFPPFLGFIKKRVLQLILAYPDKVLALTSCMRNELIQICSRDDITIIPNGIDVTSFGSSKCKLKSNVDERSKKILWIGRFSREKGVRYLIEATCILKKQYSEDLKLILVGHGADENILKNLVNQLNLKQNVVFTGKVQNCDVAFYMKDSDVFVLPSLTEGFPNVLLEALAAGLPVVATNVCGVPEIIIDRENGLLVQPKDSQEIADRIREILEDKELRNKISRNNKKRATTYDLNTCIDMLEGVYRTLVTPDT